MDKPLPELYSDHVDLAEADPVAEVRGFAAMAVSMYETPEADEVLRRVGERDVSPSVRKTAVRMLEMSKRNDAAEPEGRTRPGSGGR